ncbi:MAG TPA: DUF3459 domain-containing protein, partial [Gammaproteobacteria bacterium]|nr:DUF3459 domain-containing protein [Gammaproteobacteria bacterium]
LAARREHIVPRLHNMQGNSGEYQIVGPNAFVVNWRLGDESQLILAANLSDVSVDGFPAAAGQAVWSEGEISNSQAAPWTVLWRLNQGEKR